MTRFHVAQVNIGRLRAPIDDPIMEGFRSLQLLKERGPSPDAFTFSKPFPAPEAPPGTVTGLDARFCEWAT